MSDIKPTAQGTAVYSGTCGEHLTWTLDSGGTLEISGSGDMYEYHIFQDAPWFSSDYCVTSVKFLPGVSSIGMCAFYKCADLKSIEISDTMTSIGSNAFCGCVNLENVVIPDGVTVIEDSVFSSCSNLKSVTIGKNVIGIGWFAFNNCAMLSSITFKGYAPAIAYNAFEGVCATAYYPARNPTWTKKTKQNYKGALRWKSYAAKLKSGVPAAYNQLSVFYCGKNISWSLNNGKLVLHGHGAMYDYFSWRKAPWDDHCFSVISVEIESGITRIGDYAFSGCGCLQTVSLPDSILSIGKDAFFECNELRSIRLPDGLTSIGEAAFESCKTLKDVHLSETVVSIGKDAFKSCPALRNVDIPKSVTSIGDGAFEDCVNLNIIRVSSDNPCFSAENGVLYNKDKTNLLAWPTARDDVKIPGTVTGIGNCAFSSCNNIRSVSIPDSVTSMGAFAFRLCDNLRKVTIGAGISSMDINAFFLSGNLNSITFDGDAPSRCSNAFYGVSAAVYYPAQNPTWTDSVRQSFGGSARWIPYTPKVKAPAHAEAQHAGKGETPVHAEKQNEKKGETSVHAGEQHEQKEETPIHAELDTPTDSSSISPDKATLELGQKVAQIIADYPDALENRKQLNALLQDHMPQEKRVCRTMMDAFDEGIVAELQTKKTADNLDFQRYKKKLMDGYGISDPIAEQTIELWITALGIGTVRNTQENSSDSQPGNTQSNVIEEEMDYNELFEYETFDSPGNIILNRYIGFDDKKIYVPEKINGCKVRKIQDRAFQGCDVLESVSIADGIESIGNYAFNGCKALQNVSLPNTLKTLGDAVFSGCHSLKEITLPDSLEHMGRECLDFTGITTLTLPGVDCIPRMAFLGCLSLEKVIILDKTTSIDSDAFNLGVTEIHIPDSVVDIKYDSFGLKKNENLTIYCHAGSYAQKFAREHGIKCAREQ